MISLVRGDGRLARKALALGLGFWVLAGSSALADGGLGLFGRWKKGRKADPGHHVHSVDASGTLGYGPPGVHPGFQGFGLGYHPGHGYGGDALGVGASGGGPFYGGPGYPHAAPTLRRSKGITPFPYYGGPGHPSPGHPHYFGPVGPLVVDRPTIVIGDGRGGFADFGPFTGALPDPERAFSSATIAAAAEPSGGMDAPPPVPGPETAPPADGPDLPSASIPTATGRRLTPGRPRE